MKQRSVVAVLLDHVAQLAQVMHQQPHASFVLVALLQTLEEVADLVLQLGFFHVERNGERAFNAEVLLGFARPAVQNRREAGDTRVTEDNRARPVEHPLEIEHGSDEVQRADVARFIPRHTEPEFVQSRIGAKGLCEAGV